MTMSPQTNSAYEPDDQNLYKELTFSKLRKSFFVTSLQIAGQTSNIEIVVANVQFRIGV